MKNVSKKKIHQISSKLVEFYGSYGKNIFGVFLCPTVYNQPIELAQQAENLNVIAEHVTTTTKLIIPRVAVANINNIGNVKDIFCT
jgi:hypothetical protein